MPDLYGHQSYLNRYKYIRIISIQHVFLPDYLPFHQDYSQFDLEKTLIHQFQYAQTTSTHTGYSTHLLALISLLSKIATSVHEGQGLELVINRL